jgi:peptide/nickel transport system permease protein
MTQRDREYVQACHAMGFSNSRILLRHILPAILPEIMVMASLWMATAVRTEASLAFIGLGLAPPTPTWGGMVREGFDNILSSFHLALYPSLAILILVLALNLIGDGLRDAIDPRLKDAS